LITSQALSSRRVCRTLAARFCFCLFRLKPPNWAKAYNPVRVVKQSHMPDTGPRSEFYRRNNHIGMRIGEFVSYRHVNFRAVILRNQPLQVQPRGSRKNHGGAP
jgi:hypothetical protein